MHANDRDQVLISFNHRKNSDSVINKNKHTCTRTHIDRKLQQSQIGLINIVTRMS